MSSAVNDMLVQLRCCVSFLGERDQASWWSSSFLSGSGGTFLSPVFPKTSTLARMNGASGAAQLVHDERIGIGDVYHLFRLPENIELDISQLLAKDSTVLELITSVEVAQAALKELSAGENTRGVGPHLIEGDAVDEGMIRHIASAYMHGFSSREVVYPYYRGST
jgi:hypothetical protein